MGVVPGVHGDREVERAGAVRQFAAGFLAASVCLAAYELWWHGWRRR